MAQQLQFTLSSSEAMAQQRQFTLSSRETMAQQLLVLKRDISLFKESFSMMCNQDASINDVKGGNWIHKYFLASQL